MKAATLEDGSTRTTVPLSALELQCVRLATTVRDQEEAACREIVMAAQQRHTAAMAEHRQQLDFVLYQRAIRAPEGARVRVDFGTSDLIWEVDAKAPEDPEDLTPEEDPAPPEALEEAHAIAHEMAEAGDTDGS